MDIFVRTYQPNRYQLWKKGLDKVHPEDENRRSSSSTKTPRTTSAVGNEKNADIVHGRRKIVSTDEDSDDSDVDGEKGGVKVSYSSKIGEDLSSKSQCKFGLVF